MSNLDDIITDISNLESKKNSLSQIREAIKSKIKQVELKVEENPLKFYKPTRPNECMYGDSQLMFHLSLAKERFLCGANRSGKTEAAVAELCFHITGLYPDYYPKEGRIKDGELNDRNLVIRVYGTSFLEGINQVIWQKIDKFMPKQLKSPPKYNSQGAIEEVKFKNNVLVLFGTYQQSIKAVTGTNSDFILFDEPPESERRYIEIVRGSIDKKARIVCSFTPLETDWLDDYLENATADIYERYTPFVAYLDIRDNLYLPKDEVQWWINRLSKEDYIMRVTGRPRAFLDRVYGNFDPLIHTIDDFELPFKNNKPDGWNLFFSIDPHDAKPPAMTWYALFDPELGGGLSKIFIIKEDWDENNLLIEDAIRRIIAFEEQLGVKAHGRTIDPNYGTRTSAASGLNVCQQYQLESRRLNYPLTFRMKKHDLATGHDLISRFLQIKMPDGQWKNQPQLQIFKSCPKQIKSFKNYRWKEKIKAKVKDDDNKHWQDCNRYFATAGFKFSKSTEEEVNNLISQMSTVEKHLIAQQYGLKIVDVTDNNYLSMKELLDIIKSDNQSDDPCTYGLDK